ncbi:hypothetical protein AGMMS50268_35650 [Spirochaetia bacterium]|nr:hypothetical protein AGMMS50268_35650 [Spirochaetia bacterium]
MQGDRRQLLYKGRKRSHRFTILGQDKFEYDCILNKEPDTNTVILTLDGAERFDFFRQPDWLRDPFLAGSYAVYKKATFIGEGTGKLCHIHRPKIIDSRGRWVWGDLSIVGDRLIITIPETWLAYAVYPVIVDPVIGTSTVGSLTPDGMYGGIPVRMIYQFGVNRFIAPEKIQGTCSAHFYCYDTNFSIGDYSPRVFDNVNNKPGTIRSKNEQIMRTKLWEYNADRSGYIWSNPLWKNVNFEINGQIEAGSNVWFGGYGWGVWTKYDYGGEYYRNWPEMVWTTEEEEVYDDETGEWYWTEPEGYELPDFIHNGDETFDNYILSWYFTFESSSFNYTRTLTQGVNLSDTRKLTATYKKTLAMNGRNTTALGHGSSYYRTHTAQVRGTAGLSWLRGFYRNISETIKILNPLGYCRDFLRTVTETARAYTDTIRNAGNKRTVLTTGGSNDGITWGRGFFRSILTTLQSSDTNNTLITLARNIAEWAATLDSAGHLGDYFRGLFVEAGSIAETDHAADYYRKQEDTAYTEDNPLRSLFMVIRLITVGFVRDFILKRFLKSNEDIVLKSPVCREIEIDSRIH